MFPIDVTLPGGAFDGTRGWKSNRSATKFQYKDKTRSAANNGINKMLIQDRSRKDPNRLRVRVMGKLGNYPVFSGDEPVKAIVVVGNGALGECGETEFGPEDCRSNASGNAIRCR